MFVLAMLFWTGYQLTAPTWYWVLWGFVCFYKIISFGVTLYKKGAESR